MIAKAEPSDLPHVVELLYAYVNECLLNMGIVPHLQSGRDFLVRLVTEENMCLFVARVNEHVVGFIGGEVCHPWYNEYHLVAQQHMWYVGLKHRNTPVGVKLLRAFERWAKDKGANVILMPVILHTDSTAALKVLNKSGYKQIEAWYKKEVRDGR